MGCRKVWNKLATAPFTCSQVPPLLTVVCTILELGLSKLLKILARSSIHKNRSYLSLPYHNISAKGELEHLSQLGNLRFRRQSPAGEAETH
jgi:hypothetical protein